MKENKKFVEYVNGPSLAEVNNTVPIPKNTSFWKNIVAFSGPGALVAVGYMDPGNWITSIGGGAQYGYLLLSVVFVSSLIAMLLQYMASKLGIVTGLDLAQATRKHTSRRVGFILWMITELAIMATDIAEVIGGAIALNLLFGLPIIWGVILTVFDVLLLLFLMKLGFRKIEAIVITLILVIMVVFVYEVAISNPVLADMLKGFVPQKEIFNRGQLTMALGIVGATVMPHNLYLHSSIAQTRSYDRKDEDDVARAVRFSTWDSNIQLTVAFIINTLLLVLGAAMFFGRGEGLGTFTSLYNALQDNKLAGAVASPVLSTLFAVALLSSGQNSTITGTLSGQIVMEGFINLKVPTWARRLITRGLSVIPVLIAAIYYHGREGGLDILMIRSQVFLSIALPVSMIPLVYFTSSEQIMGKRFKNKRIIAGLGWLATIVLTILNIKLIIGMF
ncbi:manganese transporter [Lactococcus chungangensis CAU 28 = DSM 22330]|uniref:Divalent metal cation transporter MntH n=1 Tax=Pseudolactococcus chungangensis CAU 28 = DSM 22330 TaxID=1122154 RepID=A0A1K2HDV5_9LACT|nr:Nramp family divalent metal transporter [Lactococcus chungangensis]NCB81222.1 divalent metal cation transporter [Bacilli bacterium]PCS03637.1 manganese transporter [Lactococcus chungangensis CAU 28 = DSM 22330]SFZ74931.1 manganese transport protein [Lactococcus chungangensis CAU 28 = DSM 22330]